MERGELLLLSGLLGLGLLGGLGLENVLDDLLLLNEEGANNPLLHAARATRATISALHGLGTPGEVSVLARAEVGDLQEMHKKKEKRRHMRTKRSAKARRGPREFARLGPPLRAHRFKSK